MIRRVLIIEDNDTDYLLMQRHLHRVWPAADLIRSTNRQELLMALTQTWNLIVTDFHLPDIQSRELIQKIAEEQPAVPCLVTSGSIDELRAFTFPENVVAYIEKGDNEALRQALSNIAD